ncbi:MAG: hypothetical protein JSW39_10840 [Desulfobacterales bacterium]|nr:MAG: hypothetical protein JSW39_10840 [Desulfobacterales bacterium]
MATLSPERIYDLLGTCHIPGTEEQKAKLFIRISELSALNGEKWIRENREQLLDQWNDILQQGLLT